MKIKEMCELTGLTDKTVRFYIDNGLITPECKENHLGRRSFTFSKQNLSELEDIATLRKAGFSVAQIKEIQNEKEKSREIIPQLIALKEKQIEENKLINAALSQLESDRAYSVREIAEVLREPARDVKPLLEDEDWVYLAVKWAKLFICVYMSISPIVVYVLGFVFCFSDSGLGYGWLITPRDWAVTVLAGIAALIPSCIFALSFFVKKVRNVIQFSTLHNGVVFLLLLIMSVTVFNFYLVLVGSAGSDFKAETYSVKDYSSTCFYAEENLLPDSVPESVLEQAENCGHRYSCSCEYPVRYYFSTHGNFIEGTSNQLYAEWVLNQESLKNELARIEDSFGKGTDYSYGNFTVKVFEYENIGGVKNCCAFAYNASTGNVRYIYCSGFVSDAGYYCERVSW